MLVRIYFWRISSVENPAGDWLIFAYHQRRHRVPVPLPDVDFLQSRRLLFCVILTVTGFVDWLKRRLA